MPHETPVPARPNVRTLRVRCMKDKTIHDGAFVVLEHLGWREGMLVQLEVLSDAGYLLARSAIYCTLNDGLGNGLVQHQNLRVQGADMKGFWQDPPVISPIHIVL